MRYLIAALALVPACATDAPGTPVHLAEEAQPTDIVESPPPRPVGVIGVDCPADFAKGAGTGFKVGERMVNFELRNCDNEPVSAAELLCGHECLLVHFSSGWEGWYRELAPVLQAVFEENAAARLNVVTILAEQNQPGSPATSAFCKQWVAQYSLTHPVLTDPFAEYWPAVVAGGGLGVTLEVCQDWVVQDGSEWAPPPPWFSPGG